MFFRGGLFTCQIRSFFCVLIIFLKGFFDAVNTHSQSGFFEAQFLCDFLVSFPMEIKLF